MQGGFIVRKFALRMMLVMTILIVVSCAHAAQDNAGGLWLHARYSVSAPLINNVPYYTGISTITPSLYLVGNAGRYSDVGGTLIIGDGNSYYTGLHRYMSPRGTYDFAGTQIVAYDWSSPSLNELARSKIFWNLNTQASIGKVTVGAATVPPISGLGNGLQDIRPYVKLTTDSRDVITKINVYFVADDDTSGNAVPVPDVQGVRVSVYDKTGSLVESRSWTDFSNEAIALQGHTITGLSLAYDQCESIVFEYDYVDDTYTWTFTPQARPFGSASWGSLDRYPILLSADETRTFTVTNLPSYFYSVDVRAGNPSVLSVDYDFVYDEGQWNGAVFEGNQSTLTINVKGLRYGKTMLTIEMDADGSGRPTTNDRYLSKYTRYVEVWVEEDSRDVQASEWTPYISNHYTNARFVEGRPYYPSAEFSSISIALRREDGGSSGSYYYYNSSGISGNMYTDGYTGNLGYGGSSISPSISTNNDDEYYQ